MAKAKQQETHIVELNSKNIPKEVTDPTTGKKIKVTQEMIATLYNAERQITTSVAQIAIALTQVRDQKLYLLYDLETMEDYLEHRFQFSRAFGYRLLRFADVFGDSKHFSQIMEQPRKLLEIAASNDDLKKQLKEGEVTMPDGTTLTIKELTKSAALQMANDLDITKRELKAEKKKVRELSQQVEEKGKLIASYESGMAEGDFKKLTEKKAILSELFAMDAQVADIVKRLDSIESEDAQVVSKLEATLTQLLAGASKVQDKWMHLILSITPDKK